MGAPITAEQAREHLSYNSETGEFTWAVPGPGRSKKAGSHAGRGYRAIYILGRRYKSHRLAWLMVHGYLPSSDLTIDHVNGDTADNRISNLRLAALSENSMNARLCRRNTTGVKGVYRDRLKYRASIMIKGVRFSANLDTLEEATAAIKAARESLHGEFCRHA